MPILLLLDVSISMAQSVICTPQRTEPVSFLEAQRQQKQQPVDISTYSELMKSLVLYFIQTLKSKVNASLSDPIALLSYSSDVKVIVPFTKTYDDFEKQLIESDILLYDKTDLINALEYSNRFIESTFGQSSSNLIELYIFTDRCTAFDDATSPLQSFQVPYIHQFHFVSICTHSHTHCIDKYQQPTVSTTIPTFDSLSTITSNNNNELTMDIDDIDSINNQLKEEELEMMYKKENRVVRVNEFFRGTIDIINANSVSNVKTELVKTINRIINNTYTMHRSILAFGHLHSPITLFPNPSTLFNFLESSLVRKATSTMSILGYMSNKPLINPPSLSRHVIIPLISNSQPDSLPPLCPVLRKTLEQEQKTAFVHLQNDNWYGLINSIYENDTMTLVLSILEPGIDLEYMKKVVLLPNNNNNPNMTDEFSINQSSFRMSYNTFKEPSPLPSVRLENIYIDFNKLSKLFKSLPSKFEALIHECEKIRQSAALYQPTRISDLINYIKEEVRLTKLTDETSFYILQELIKTLADPNKFGIPLSLASLVEGFKNEIEKQEEQQFYQQQQQQKQYIEQQQQQQQQQQQERKTSKRGGSNR
ncbi:hypothetical protein CYY_000292 [Polysphondylium violaceum]|uniref:Integrator complex subunit 14 n=1 Tax=Polysphondylium violaceum TaxID=133409 RepID=A0A8J4Q352_9MYCE|nr:hypothetical protein CYY_000292 [Polysphondylium violaceum]